MDTSQPYIDVQRHSKWAQLTFYHPKGNSLPSLMLNELIEHLNTLSQDESLNVVVLRSAGSRTFCAGASFDELLSLEKREDFLDFFQGFARLILAMRSCPKQIITVVQGKAVGGAVGIIAASDLVLAHHDAAVKLSELSLGMGPFVIEPAITRKIGVAAYQELAFDPHAWSGAELMKQKGLYSSVWSTSEQLEDELQRLLEHAIDYSPSALRQNKWIAYADTVHWDTLLPDRAQITTDLAMSEYTQSRLKKFKAKS